MAVQILLGTVTRFIDVGANDGFTLSNTVLFALQGAHGLCFEPNPNDYRRLRAFYLTTLRVECFCEALSDRSGIMEFRSDGLLSSLTATEDTGLTNLLAPFRSVGSMVISVPVERLSRWLERRPDYEQCDVISIDVEGHELNVLLGMDWERYPRPARCFILETHSNGTGSPWLHRDYYAMDALLTRQRYFRLAASANNTFWIYHSDWEDTRVQAAKTQLPGYKWFDDHPKLVTPAPDNIPPPRFASSVDTTPGF